VAPGHDEVWGGVRINVDSNWLNLGKGSTATPETHCGGVTISFQDYPPLARAKSGTAPAPALVKALQCLLTERAGWKGQVNGHYNSATVQAVKAFQTSQGFAPDAHGHFYRRDWMAILSIGDRPVQKIGSAGGYVRRVQRALNASGLGYDLKNTGVFDSATAAAVRAYQKHEGVPVTGVVNALTWTKLMHGQR